MPLPSAAKLLTVVLAGAVTAAVVAGGACGGSDGITPTCTYNVDDAGNILPDPDGGCVQFLTCNVGDGNAANCCLDADGGTLTGSDLANCLYGYGACPNIQTDDAGNSTCDGGTSGTGGGGTGGTGGTGGSNDAGSDGGDAGDGG